LVFSSIQCLHVALGAIPDTSKREGNFHCQISGIALAVTRDVCLLLLVSLAALHGNVALCIVENYSPFPNYKSFDFFNLKFDRLSYRLHNFLNKTSDQI
jgi:hypothetical protein